MAAWFLRRMVRSYWISWKMTGWVIGFSGYVDSCELDKSVQLVRFVANLRIMGEGRLSVTEQEVDVQRNALGVSVG